MAKLNITEERLGEIIRESISEMIDFVDLDAPQKPSRSFVGGNVSSFTPYSKEEAEANRKAIGRVGNPSYDKFKAWREEGLRRGIPSRELSWNRYMQEKS